MSLERSRPATLTFRVDDLTDERVRALVRHHLAGMHENTPPEGVHALDLDRLVGPGMTFWSGWDGDEVAVIGALKHLDDVNGEVKSMRVSDDHLGKGAGRTMLRVILDEADRRGYRDVWLETGDDASFQRALALYRSEGFVETGPFGDYSESPWSIFMRRTSAASE